MKSPLMLALAFVAFALASCTSRPSDQRRKEQWSASPPQSAPPPVSSPADAPTGRALFLKNCAHCHGADAHGNEGPDLHDLDWTDEQIATRIRNGKKGQMTAFAGKISPEDVKELILYLRTLK